MFSYFKHIPRNNSNTESQMKCAISWILLLDVLWNCEPSRICSVSIDNELPFAGWGLGSINTKHPIPSISPTWDTYSPGSPPGFVPCSFWDNLRAMKACPFLVDLLIFRGVLCGHSLFPLQGLELAYSEEVWGSGCVNPRLAELS